MPKKDSGQRPVINLRRLNSYINSFACVMDWGPAPRNFTKIMKVPVALLRRLNIRLIIYLDDILILASCLKKIEMEMARDSCSTWCSRRKIHPFRCSLADILEFFSVSFEEGPEYNTISGYRSALSAYHEPIEGLSVGSHPLVSKLIAGIFNKRPPKPRYTFIYFKQLTLKLAMLLALTSLHEHTN